MVDKNGKLVNKWYFAGTDRIVNLEQMSAR